MPENMLLAMCQPILFREPKRIFNLHESFFLNVEGCVKTTAHFESNIRFMHIGNADMGIKEEILGWLSAGNNQSSNIVDLKWVVTDEEGRLKLVNEKVPFTIYIGFHPDTLHIKVKTGIETAVIDQTVRLATYHSLLILNSSAELVKFMLEGSNEEIVARSDVQTQSLTKNELNESFNKLLSALYKMVKALKLEEQFNKQITERMMLMIQGMINEGKSRVEIRDYLIKEIGLSGDESDMIMNEIMPHDQDNEGMYR